MPRSIQNLVSASPSLHAAVLIVHHGSRAFLHAHQGDRPFADLFDRDIGQPADGNHGHADKQSGRHPGQPGKIEIGRQCRPSDQGQIEQATAKPVARPGDQPDITEEKQGLTPIGKGRFDARLEVILLDRIEQGVGFLQQQEAGHH